MKKALAIGIVLIASLGLAACNDMTIEEVERISKLKTACEDAEGYFYQHEYTGQYLCSLNTRED